MYGDFKKLMLCLSTAVSVAGTPLLAYAEPPPDPPTNASDGELERAKELFENGKGLYAEGSYSAAIAAFRQAYSLSGDPVLLYNIALAHDRAGEFDAALEYLGYYRAYAPESERTALSAKEDSLRKRKLRAQTEDEEAAVAVAEQEPEESGEGPPPPSVSPTDEGPTDDGMTNKPQQKIFTVPVWVLTGVSVVGLGVGTGLGVTALGRRDDAEALCTADGMDGTVCPEEAGSDVDSSRRLALGADVAFGVGAAAGVVAIVLIIRNASRRKKTQTATLVPRPRGAGLQLRF